MTTYHKHGLSVSNEQVRKLAQGHTIRLKTTDLSGPVSLYLTKTQIDRLNRCHQKGVGCDLKLSNAQMRYHVKTGGSIFDTIWSGIKDAGESAYNNVIKPVVGSVIQKALPRVQQKGEDVLNGLADRALKKVGAGRCKKRVGAGRCKKHVVGEGFFDDVWGGIKSVADVALPIATNIGSTLLAKRLGMGVKKRGKKGGSFMLPGGQL